jgi:transcriptional antiterminator RfaH
METRVARRRDQVDSAEPARDLQGLVWVIEAMFPGYLFAQFELAAMHRQVRYAHGVSGLVQFDDRYPTIEDGTLAQLRDHSGPAEIREVSYELSQSDRVKSTEGGYVGLEGHLAEMAALVSNRTLYRP